MMGFPQPAVKAVFDAAVTLAEGVRQHERATATTQADADAADLKYHRAVVAAAAQTGDQRRGKLGSSAEANENST